MKRNLLSILVALLTIVANADEYIDPQSKVVYTYTPGEATASVKAGYEEITTIGHDIMETYYPGSPYARGDVEILDKFTVGTSEYVVTSIGPNAFRNSTYLTSVTVPGSVKSIGERAFNCCRELTSITIQSGVTSLAYGTFGGCSSLTSIRIPDGVLAVFVF